MLLSVIHLLKFKDLHKSLQDQASLSENTTNTNASREGPKPNKTSRGQPGLHSAQLYVGQGPGAPGAQVHPSTLRTPS